MKFSLFQCKTFDNLTNYYTQDFHWGSKKCITYLLFTCSNYMANVTFLLKFLRRTFSFHYTYIIPHEYVIFFIYYNNNYSNIWMYRKKQVQAYFNSLLSIYFEKVKLWRSFSRCRVALAYFTQQDFTSRFSHVKFISFINPGKSR